MWRVGLPMCLTVCAICVVFGIIALQKKERKIENQSSDWCCVNLRLK